jgi:uncharacterized RDD family membrane protein YckC
LFQQPRASRAPARLTEAGEARTAGFWRRALAYSIDWLLLAPLMYLLLRSPVAAAWGGLQRLNSVLQDWLLTRLTSAAGAMPSPTELAAALIQDAPMLASVDAALGELGAAVTQAALSGAAIAGLYFIGFEASAWQATPGKRLLDLTVVDVQGARLGWGRASARFLAGSLSWLSLNLGHALAGLRADGRALHDLVAGTRVVAHSPMPRWARWLLFAQLALLLVLMFGLLGRLLWLLAQLAAAGVL